MEFQSHDRSFGLQFPTVHVANLLQICRNAGQLETGGILVGYYTPEHDWAFVTDVSGPPSDSRAASTWFYRGIQALQDWLHHLWLRRTTFYLGEWHFHPNGTPDLSSLDIEQMNSIARSRKYQCPEPVLVVIGGPALASMQARVYVFPGNSPHLELLPVGP